MLSQRVIEYMYHGIFIIMTVNGNLQGFISHYT